MRVGDQERERVVAALRKQFADGHLDLDDFGDRVERAYAAVTVDELNGCLADLPIPVNPVPPPRPVRAPVAPVSPAAPAPSSPAQMSRKPAYAVPAATPRLPVSPARAGQVARRSFYAHLGPYVVVNTFLVMIYVLTNFGGYFWPIWPMMGWGVGLGIHAWAAFVVAARGSD